MASTAQRLSLNKASVWPVPTGSSAAFLAAARRIAQWASVLSPVHWGVSAGRCACLLFRHGGHPPRAAPPLAPPNVTRALAFLTGNTPWSPVKTRQPHICVGQRVSTAWPCAGVGVPVRGGADADRDVESRPMSEPAWLCTAAIPQARRGGLLSRHQALPGVPFLPLKCSFAMVGPTPTPMQRVVPFFLALSSCSTLPPRLSCSWYAGASLP